MAFGDYGIYVIAVAVNNQIGVTVGLQAALLRIQTVGLRRIAADNLCHNLRGNACKQSILNLLLEGIRRNGKLLLAAVGKCYAHAAVGIRAHGDFVHRHALFVKNFDGVTGLDAGGEAVLLPDAGGDIYITA